MSPPPTSIDGTEITGATIDGQDVEEITVDGQTVFAAGPPIAPVNRIYTGDFGSQVEQYDTTSKFDLTGATQTATLSGKNRDVHMTADGEHFYVADFDNSQIRHFDVPTAYDVGSISGGASDSLSISDAHGVTVSPDGTDVVVGKNDVLNYGTLSTPYNISTFQSQSIENFATAHRNCTYAKEGEFLFNWMKNSSNQVFVTRYQMTTPFDFSTRGSPVQESLPFEPAGLSFSTDGSKFFTSSFKQDLLREYDVPTPFDLSNVSSVDTFAVTDAISLFLL